MGLPGSRGGLWWGPPQRYDQSYSCRHCYYISQSCADNLQNTPILPPPPPFHLPPSPFSINIDQKIYIKNKLINNCHRNNRYKKGGGLTDACTLQNEIDVSLKLMFRSLYGTVTKTVSTETTVKNNSPAGQFSFAKRAPHHLPVHTASRLCGANCPQENWHYFVKFFLSFNVFLVSKFSLFLLSVCENCI